MKFRTLLAGLATAALVLSASASPIIHTLEIDELMEPGTDYLFKDDNIFDLVHPKVMSFVGEFTLPAGVTAPGLVDFAFDWLNLAGGVEFSPFVTIEVFPGAPTPFEAHITLDFCPQQVSVDFLNKGNVHVHVKGIFTHECLIPPPVPENTGWWTAPIALMSLLGAQRLSRIRRAA